MNNTIITSTNTWTGLFVLVVGSIVLAPLATAYGDSQGYRTDIDSCRNSQIISYTPHSGSQVDQELGYIEYVVSRETKISSLQARINGESYPVEYRAREDGAYRARVAVPEDLEGAVYVDMGAGSEFSGACNDLLSMSFILDPHEKFDDYGVPTTAPASFAHGSDPEALVAAQQFVGSVSGDVVAQENTIQLTELVSVGGVTAGDQSQELTQEETANEVAGAVAQTATVLGGLSFWGRETSCTTWGAMWPWYAWLGLVWLYLVAVWLVLGHVVEPLFGQERYVQRLGWTIGASTVLGIMVWWMANPCYTHLWVPMVLAFLGLGLYWLYSEEEPQETGVGETKTS